METRSTSGRRSLSWASWTVAALSAGYIAWSLPSPVGIACAIGLPLLVLRLPVTGIVLMAVLAQEIKPNGRYGVLTTLGNQVFFGPGKIPILLPLALTAALAATMRWWPSKDTRLHPGGATLLGSTVALILLATGSGLLNRQSILSAVNQNARPFVLLLMGLIVGVSLRWLRNERKLLTTMTGVALTCMLVAAAIAIPLGGSADPQLSRYFIYYDSALPAIAAAVLIGVLGHIGWRWDWQQVTVTASIPLLIVISFRRSVWIAAAVVVIAALALTWRRWRQMAGQLAFAGSVTAMVVLSAPGLASDIGLRSVGSLTVGEGSSIASNKPRARANVWHEADQAAPSKPSATGQSPNAVPSKPGGASPSANSAPSKPGNTPPGARQATPNPPAAERAMRQAESTSGHIEDLRVGWRYVRANFWTGVGPVSPQLPGLAARGGSRIYVHNELLQDWLQYGLMAPLLVIVFLVAAGLMALRALRDRGSDIIVRSAAAFCLITPLCLMTAPFLSTTSRWPLLVGIAAGVLVAHEKRDRALESSGVQSPLAG